MRESAGNKIIAVVLYLLALLSALFAGTAIDLAIEESQDFVLYIVMGLVFAGVAYLFFRGARSMGRDVADDDNSKVMAYVMSIPPTKEGIKIDEIAANTKVKPEDIKRILRALIGFGDIKGYVQDDKFLFDIKEKWIAVQCQSCGAPTKKLEGKVAQCEYCKSPI